MTISKLKIVKTFQDGSFAVECAFCEGDGIFPETTFDDDDLIQTEPCPVCYGKGINIFKAKDDCIIECRYCGAKGRGWDENGYFQGAICSVCNGTGLFILESISESQAIALDDIIWSIIHPIIVKIAQSRFKSGHYSDSVEAALKEVNTRVKKIVKERIGEELDGAPLMQRALSLDNSVLDLADLSTESGKNIQKGYLQIFSGVMTGIRNPKAHENIVIDRKRAIHLLFLASLLMSRIDEASIPHNKALKRDAAKRRRAS